MAAIRRARGSLHDPLKIGLTVERESDKRAAQVARHISASKSELVQWLIDSMQLDARGVPVGWPHSVPLDEGELDLKMTS